MILIVASDSIPHIGGKSTHIMDLIAGMKMKNVDTILFSRAQYPSMLLKIIKIPLLPFKLYDSKYYAYLLGKIWRGILSRKVWSLYKNNKPSCISCQDAFAVACLKRYRAKMDCPIVLTMHTYFGLENALDSKKNHKIREKIYYDNMKFELESLVVADKIIAVDNRILEHVKETIERERHNLSIRVKYCTSIENFTNSEVFKPGTVEERYRFRTEYNIKSDSFVIICARRLVEKNGVVFAVKAMRYLSEDSVLVIAGDGPQLSLIKEIIEQEELVGKIVLLGAVQPQKIVDLYKMSDCSVVPSITVNGLQEATSISALEAMSCGLPVVASRIGGLRQLISDGVDGYLVDEKNPEKIAEAIQMLKKDSVRGEMADNAREFVVQTHSYIQGAEMYIKEFDM